MFFKRLSRTNLKNTPKKSEIRDEVIILFWKKLQNLNDVFIQANIIVKSNENALAEGLCRIKNTIFEIAQYYDTNEYDLSIFSKEYKRWQEAWNKFVKTFQEYNDLEHKTDMSVKLGLELQSVKDRTQDLIKTVRNKF